MRAQYSSEFSRVPIESAFVPTIYELCLAEQCAAKFDMATHKCSILDRNLLPVSLYRVDETSMYSAIINWLIRRALPISRKNYDAIIKSVGIAGNTDVFSIISKYYALSLVDNYWIRPEQSNLQYSEINLYQHHFADLLSVSLFGEKPLTVSDTSPDINQRGCMSKCYSRENDKIFIYKYSEYTEKIYAEVFASKLAQVCGFDTIAYTTATKQKKLCSKCQIGTSVDINWITASELSLAGMNPKEIAVKLTPERYYQMLFFDYVTGNIDRHNENWSFLMNNYGVILGLTPLYDFDNCFIAEDNEVSKITLRPMIRDAIIALNNLNKATNIITTLSTFLQTAVLDDSSYKSFAQYSLSRLNDLSSSL